MEHSRHKRNRRKKQSLGFAGALIVGSHPHTSNSDYSEVYESQNISPKVKKKASAFRSTFHNTINGKFLDLPPLNERHDYSNEYNPTKRQSVNDGCVLPNAKKSNPSQTSNNFYKNRNPLPDANKRKSSERPQNRGKANCIGLDLRPATPISVIKITSVECFEDEITGQKKISSPIRNTLAKNREKYLNGYAKNTCRISKYGSHCYDSTQDTLNIEAYMRDNSTLAIQEVDEDDPDCNLTNQKTIKPRELPHLDYSPNIKAQEIRDALFTFPKIIKKRTDGLILVEENEPVNKVPPLKL